MEEKKVVNLPDGRWDRWRVQVMWTVGRVGRRAGKVGRLSAGGGKGGIEGS